MMNTENSLFALVSIFSGSLAFTSLNYNYRHSIVPTSLYVTVGLGPNQEQQEQKEEEEEEVTNLVPGVDYEIPNHEAHRLDRRNRLDEKCDAWFGSLLGEINDGAGSSFLGDVAKEAYAELMKPAALGNEFILPQEHPDFTPYVSTTLPWQIIYPAYGLEQYGIPIPRRNAEAWRQFDVQGMVNQNYADNNHNVGMELQLTEGEIENYKAKLRKKGGWLEDAEVEARLVYINGQFSPQLSSTTKNARNIMKEDVDDIEVKNFLSRLTDGFTDELAAPVIDGDNELLSFRNLSAPDHNMRNATSQYAVNFQQGSACFAALNSIRTGAVAFVRVPEKANANTEESENVKPILIVNGLSRDFNGTASVNKERGVALHPRTLVIAEQNSVTSLVQSIVDLDEGEARPTLHNGYTQIYMKNGAKFRHTYLEESGGIVTAGTEKTNEELFEGEISPRIIESERPALKDTHLETIDVQVVGNDASYEGVIMNIGGSGRVRIAHSISVLRRGCHAAVKGFSLSGGAQKTDIRTNIHHIADGTTSEQVQKSMIGGRATGSFRGRVRVEQSAQQTNSEQLSRTVMLSDRCTFWAAPTMEIIADDVKCAHGATVSDLSEEELFYLRSRGLDRTSARSLLMYGFADDITSSIEPAMRGEVDGSSGVPRRVFERLENLVPKGKRKAKSVFQSI
mmetsp:Transcript_27118/g.30943  ORF Transcript_27118/g.30943 Transcript_27118/m.30943 type:complete len:680 (+) Transcript_27118:136-2175(+)